MTRSRETPPPREVEQQMSDYYFDVFAHASGGGVASMVRRAKEFFGRMNIAKSKDPFEYASAIRRSLISQEFQYDDGVFCLEDMIREKKGNCLGLSLLIGAELRRNGFAPEYQIILHPMDAIDAQDKKLFQELSRGEHFDYDQPKLADVQAEHPLYRFAPLAHPALVLGGKRFETTGLDDIGEDPGWSPDAELIQQVDFTQVASNVYVDRAKTAVKKGKFKLDEVKQLALSAVQMWPDNREGWAFVFDVAESMNDNELSKQAKAKYLAIGGQDSRFYNTAYKMTGDRKFLDLALEKFPAYLEPFVEKGVVLEKDQKEAAFNLAVASWCAANSSAFSLKWFYERYTGEVERLFGKKTLQALRKSI